MEYDLTSTEKSLVTWIVEANASGELDERFAVAWFNEGEGGMISQGYAGKHETVPQLEPIILDSLEAEGLLRCKRNTRTTSTLRGNKKPKTDTRERETGRWCTLTRGAREAVENNFVREDPQPQQPSVINQTNNFNAEVSQAAIGPHSHVELTQNLDLGAVRTRIDNEGGEYQEDLHRLLDLAESVSRDGVSLERGALSEFNEAMQDRSWIVSPVVSLLLGFLST
jgi:hypothetical protein